MEQHCGKSTNPQVSQANKEKSRRFRVRGVGRERQYLGEYGTPASIEAYHRLLAEWEAGARNMVVVSEEITVVEMLVKFLAYAKTYRRNRDGSQSAEFDNYIHAMKPLKGLYGSTPAGEFGPKRLKAVRGKMIDGGWCRSNVNRMVSRVKRIFSWAESEELVPKHTHAALMTVSGLRPGRRKDGMCGLSHRHTLTL